MESKPLGRTGEKIPEVGQGTWNYGGGPEPLRVGVTLGATLIDTAEMYGTEDAVGEAVKGLDDVFLATKVSAQHLHHDALIKAAEASLKRLQVKTIDLYQIHWPNPHIPIIETMHAMEELVRAGRIRYIGVSNFSVAQTKEAQAALSSQEIVSNQVEYSLLSREIEADLLPYCAEEHITVIAYSPLARGRIAYTRDDKSKFLETLAQKYGKTRSQMALNWLTYRENVMVIPKADKLEHVKENCGATGWRLSTEDFEAVNRTYA